MRISEKSNAEFRQKCLNSREFFLSQDRLDTNLFTEEEAWEGASEGTKAFNEETKMWVIIHEPTQ